MKRKKSAKGTPGKDIKTEVPTENKYQAGATVKERVHPYRKLKIQKYEHRVYYCEVVADPDLPVVAVSEREIMPA